MSPLISGIFLQLTAYIKKKNVRTYFEATAGIKSFSAGIALLKQKAVTQNTIMTVLCVPSSTFTGWQQ